MSEPISNSGSPARRITGRDTIEFTDRQEYMTKSRTRTWPEIAQVCSLVCGLTAIALLLGIRFVDGRFPRYDGPGGLLELIILAPFALGMLLLGLVGVAAGLAALVFRSSILAFLGTALSAVPLVVVFNLLVVEPERAREKGRLAVQQSQERLQKERKQRLDEFAQTMSADKAAPLSIQLAQGSAIGPIRTPGYGGRGSDVVATGHISREPGKNLSLVLDLSLNDRYYEIANPASPISTSNLSMHLHGDLTTESNHLQAFDVSAEGKQRFSNGEERDLELNNAKFYWFPENGRYSNARIEFQLQSASQRPAYSYWVALTVLP